MDANKYVTFCYIQDSLEAFVKVAEALMPERRIIFRNEDFLGRESEVVKGRSQAEVIIVSDVWEPNSTSKLIDRINKLKEILCA